MALLTITIEIDEQPLTGHQHHKLAKDFGEDDASILGRIAKANQDVAGHRAEPVAVVVKAICEAVRAAEAEPVVPD